jgi:hypothetical protein
MRKPDVAISSELRMGDIGGATEEEGEDTIGAWAREWEPEVGLLTTAVVFVAFAVEVDAGESRLDEIRFKCKSDRLEVRVPCASLEAGPALDREVLMRN